MATIKLWPMRPWFCRHGCASSWSKRLLLVAFLPAARQTVSLRRTLAILIKSPSYIMCFQGNHSEHQSFQSPINIHWEHFVDRAGLNLLTHQYNIMIEMESTFLPDNTCIYLAKNEFDIFDINLLPMNQCFNVLLQNVGHIRIPGTYRTRRHVPVTRIVGNMQVLYEVQSTR